MDARPRRALQAHDAENSMIESKKEMTEEKPRLLSRPGALTQAKDSLLNPSTWIQPEPLMAKGKLPPKGLLPNHGPLEQLGGGLNMSRSECQLLVGVVVLAAAVRLWHIERPSSVV